jgi:hypothetical protein
MVKNMNPLKFFLAMLAISSYGMVKWTSALFSDGRGKLGDQVVFGNWKGRTYMRAYVIPSNPNSLKQQAHRDWNKQAVQFWQANAGADEDALTAWNVRGLSRSLPGYNIFMKLAHAIEVSVVSAPGAAGHATLTVTYTCPVDLSDAMIVVHEPDDTWNIVKDQGEVEAGTDKTATYDTTQAGEHEIYFMSYEVYHALSDTIDELSCHAHWKANEATGKADPAVVTAVLG